VNRIGTEYRVKKKESRIWLMVLNRIGARGNIIYTESEKENRILVTLNKIEKRKKKI
jgi:hypothetical protein